MPQHIGIVACSAEGAALCYRTICLEGAELLGRHNHPEVSLHTHPLAEYMKCIDQGDWTGVAELMMSSAEKLARAGADFLICPSGGMFGPRNNDPIVQARSRETHKYIVFVHPAEFLVTAPDGTIVEQTLLGDKLLISPDQIGTDLDLKRVFYVDLPQPGNP